MYCKDKDFRPIYFFEDVEMGVVGDDVLSIGCDSTLNKFVVVNIRFYKAKMEI